MHLELDDGTKLETAWNDSLAAAQTYFRALLSSASSSSWKLVSVLPLTASTTARDSGEGSSKAVSSLGRITAADVAVHRRQGKTGEVYRAVVEVDCGADVGVDVFRGCLATPETRPHWDRMIEESQLLDLLDPQTRVTKTKYRLGWPSSPRDAVLISRTMVDRYTLIDISTSLPRSRHEPAYLRPSPPYVRAHVALLAWCVQLPGSPRVEPALPSGKARITCFWSWNPKGAWAVGGGVPQHLPSVMVGLVDFVREESSRVPLLKSWGSDISIGSVGYDTRRVTLSVGYTVVDDGEDDSRRQVEFGLSPSEGWDVQILIKTQHGEESPSTAWTSFVGRTEQASAKQIVLRFAHARLPSTEELVRVKVTLERTTGTSIRINGIPITIERMSPSVSRRPLLEETASASGISLQTMSTLDSAKRDASVERKPQSGRSAAVERSIASLIKRNYIYFTSLLQEPEQKWRPVADSRGVAVHQLNSIDKTLVVFRAEALFVGVGVWDLFATIANPGCRYVWDKSHDDSTLLEDVNELTDLWHLKAKAAWPVAARDSVLLRTTYKSPSSVHIFGFSVDNTDLFPGIPPAIDPAVIRTQIDLQGWSIEALSPNTTQVTLLEQSDPRGWSNKSSIPQVMMTTLAGIGEFAIRHGAPPVATRLGGGRAVYSNYDVDKETFRYEYEAADARRSNSSSTATAFPLPVAVRDVDTHGETNSLKSLGVGSGASNVECEIRCDDQWAGNLAITIEPPALAVSTLKRHRLSPNGGGLWLTIEHEPRTLTEGKATVTIRRGGPSTNGKMAVTINGAKIKVDTEELSEADVQLLKKAKRSKPTRIPLDQPPALGTIRKKQSKPALHAPATAAVDPRKLLAPTSSFGRFATPISRWYSAAAESTRAVIVPVATPSPATMVGSTAVDAAVRALGRLVRMHADRDGESTDPFGWQPVSDRDGLKIERRVVAHVSETFPVFRAGRILEGFTAEEVSATVSMLRKTDSFDKPVRLQSYGHGILASHAVAHTTYLFRDRSTLLASVVARVPAAATTAAHAPISTIFHAATSSFDPATLAVDPAKYNPTALPSCNVLLEGWILETIDPYSHEQYAIPSTRCMYVGAVDYSGSMPISVNNLLNASLPRALLAVEATLKTAGPPSRTRSPPMSVFVPDLSAAGPWALTSVDKNKQPIDQTNDSHEFKMTVTIQPSAKSPDDERHPLRHHDSKTSVLSNRTAVINLAEDIRRGRHDLLVAEVDLAAELVKHGCEIEVRGLSLPAALDRRGDDAVLPFEPTGEHVVLPFKCAVVALAPSVMQSASLDPALAARHMLRVTLPTSGYETPVNDPLTGQQAGPLPRPRWLLDLINDGAVIQMRLTSKKAQPAVYTFAGDVVAVDDEKKLSGRLVPADPAKIKLPQLVSAGTPGSHSLEKPLAIAREFLPDAPAPLADEANADAATDVDEAAKTELESVAPTDAKPESVPPPLSPPPLRSNRYSFWKYGALTRFAASAPVPAEASPAQAAAGTSPAPAPAPDPAGAQTATRAEPTPADLLLWPAVPLPVLAAACLACLLLGSLLRSVLSDADFVIYQSAGGAAPEGETWRELKRLAEWRIGFGRDLIVAVARRGH